MNYPARSVAIDALAEYPVRLDVRSPAEFALDRIPGAVNVPVLDDHERARVGTLHQQESAFAAKKLGAALVARNIALWIETRFAGNDRSWRPLVYCWRGGKRSGSLTHVLNEIGWKAVQLDGGYRSWRRHVVRELETLPARFHYVVVCGLTGSGKSRLLRALASLAAEGAQVLDLEAIACHRGSLLGDLPADPQPGQKWFESQIFEALRGFDPRRPVFVESESRRIGNLQVPDALLARMREGTCFRVDTPTPLRVGLLKDEYRHFLADPGSLVARLAPLVPLHGRERVQRWTQQARLGDWDALVADLLLEHYDPAYVRSIQRNFPAFDSARVDSPDDLSEAAFSRLARRVLERHGAPFTSR